MQATGHIGGDWVWSILAFYAYSAAVQTMPRPLPGDRWYGWLYGFLQVLGANLKDALSHRDMLTTTTTTQVIGNQNGGTVVRKVQEVKVTPDPGDKG